jgi:hypothetical protein
MDGVAAEVAQEVGVFLQNQDLNSGPRQQKPQHHSGGSPPAIQQRDCNFSGTEEPASIVRGT